MTDPFLALVPPNILGITPYEPGKPMEELERELGIAQAIKLASNENPLGPSPRAVVAAQAAIAGVNRYPDGGAFRLRRRLAETLGVSLEELVLGAGSNELIELLVQVFCRPGEDEVLSHKCAFVMYRLACQAMGVAFREADVTPELACDVDALLSAIGPKTKLIFLPNPNNPTGSYVPRAAFERLLEGLPPQVILCVDEAYFEYATVRADYPVAERYRAHRPLIVSLRTFSKIYGLAGLRVGYGIADRRVVGILNRVRAPFNVGSVAQEAALAALDDVSHVERSRQVNTDGLAQLATGMAGLPVTLYPSAGNFVLVDLGREARPVYAALLQKGIIARPFGAPGLLRHLRLSVGTKDENARALAAFADVLAP